MQEVLYFFHFVGIIIALGAVTVIDSMGFISKNSKKWTQTTIQAHHVTKPLIWIGTAIMTITYLMMPNNWLIIKNILIPVLIINGAFLSFYVSPRLDELAGKNVLLPLELKIKITVSMLVSFFCWWTLVYLSL